MNWRRRAESRNARCEGHRYRNSPAAAAFLSGSTASDLRPMLRLWDRISYPLWVNLEDAVRTGEGQRQFNRFSSA